MLQLLPYQFKRVGQLLITLGISAFAFGFFSGLFFGGECMCTGGPETLFDRVGKILEQFHLALFPGILIYLFSKEKVHDEFINAIKLQAVFIAFGLTVIFAFFYSYTNDTSQASLRSFIILQTIAYYFSFRLLKTRSIYQAETV